MLVAAGNFTASRRLLNLDVRAGTEVKRRGKADVIATPCPLCQQNVEMYRDAVNKKFGASHKIPVVFYSQLMAAAFGMDGGKDAGLDQNVIRATKLENMAKT